MTEQIAIYGVGGFGREVAWLVDCCNDSSSLYQVIGFIDDDTTKQGLVINGIPVMGLEKVVQQFPKTKIVSGLGSPKARESTMQKVVDAGLSFATIIHPDTKMSNRIEISEGTVICAGNILTTNIRLGRHVQINLDCTIGHDVVMDDYTTLAPGVHVSGCVQFGKRVYVGTGAVIINGTQEKPIIIEDDAVIGAAACVTKTVACGTTVVGIPARPLQR